MKCYKKRTLYAALTISFVMMWGIVILMLSGYVKEAKKATNDKIGSVLEESILKKVQEKTKGIHMFGLNQRPELIGSFEERTFCSKDTAITFMRPVLDAATDLFYDQQLGLLLSNRLHDRDIQQCFDSLLDTRMIQAQTALKITSSGLKDSISYYGDSTSITIDGRVFYIMDDGLVKIEYTAYVDYAFSTLWKLVPKQGLYMAIVLTLVIVGIGTAPLIKQKRRNINEKLIIEKQQVEQVIEKTPFLENEFEIQEDILIFKGQANKISQRSLQLMALFLHAENHKVSKKDIQGLCAAKGDPLNVMTSSIDRLNKYLIKIGAPFTVITDPSDRLFYILVVKEENSAQ